MKKPNTLQALTVLALLPVLAGFFAACDSGYQPKPHITHTFESQPNLEGQQVYVLIVTVSIPGRLINQGFLVMLSYPPTVTVVGKDKEGRIVPPNGVDTSNYYIMDTTIFTFSGIAESTGDITISVLDNDEKSVAEYPPISLGAP